MTTTAFFIMTQKGYDVLKEIIANGKKNQITYVVVGKDDAVVNDFSDEITLLCREHGIRHFIRGDVFEATDYAIAISWRWLLSSTSKLIVFHDSLLPKYRGFAPLVNALINQEPFVGVTALFASDHYDEGDIIAQRNIGLQYPVKIQDAIDLITPLYAEICIDILSKIKTKDEIIAQPQSHADASYSLWRDEDDYHIEWNGTAGDILQFILALGYPYKGAYTFMNEAGKIRITNAKLFKDVEIENRQPGKVIFVRDGFPVIVCGKGLLQITEMKDEQNNPVKLAKFRSRFT